MFQIQCFVYSILITCVMLNCCMAINLDEELMEMKTKEMKIQVPVFHEDYESPSVLTHQYRRLPCFCGETFCGCCTEIDIQSFNFSQEGCVKFTYIPDDLALEMNVTLNNNSIYGTHLSGRNPPPVCIPVPQFPLIVFCVRVYDIRLEGNDAHACVKLQVRLAQIPAVNVSFGCIRVGASGVGLERPPPELAAFRKKALINIHSAIKNFTIVDTN